MNDFTRILRVARRIRNERLKSIRLKVMLPIFKRSRQQSQVRWEPAILAVLGSQFS